MSALETAPADAPEEIGLDRLRMNLAFATVAGGMLLAALDQTIATPTGTAEISRLVDARRRWLARELSDWGAEDEALVGHGRRTPSRVSTTPNRSPRSWKSAALPRALLGPDAGFRPYPRRL